MKTIGYRLKELRMQRHMTQQQLADALEMSKSTISLLEHDQRKPSFETLETIADYFNVPMGNIVDDKGEIDESWLVSIFHTLNEEGRKALIQTAESFSMNPAFTDKKKEE